jgi:hypothetical protein
MAAQNAMSESVISLILLGRCPQIIPERCWSRLTKSNPNANILINRFALQTSLPTASF